MNTILDTRRELELVTVSYDGENLSVEVRGLESGERHRMVADGTRYVVIFAHPVMHLVNEEFPVAVADLITGGDTGFLKVVRHESLIAGLGLNVPPFENHVLFSLITAHEILFVFCKDAPNVEQMA